MAHGKDSARDLRYGRRRGAWANSQSADEALDELAALREQGLAEGTWPGSSLAEVEPVPSLFDDEAT